MLYDKNPFDFVEPGSEESSYPELFRRFLNQLPASGAVLDIGCGAGRDLAGAVARRKSTLGIDRSLVSARRARRFAPVLCADATFLPLANRSVSAVILDGVAHHTREPFRCLGEAARVLVPGGSLYIAVYKKSGHYPLLYRFPGALFRWLARTESGRRGLARFAVPLYGWLHGIRRRVRRSPEALGNLFADYFLTPIATFHSRAEVEAWANACGMSLKQYDPFRGGNCHLFLFEKTNSGSRPMARILFVASVGGHLTELLRVREHLKGHEAVFAVNSPTELPRQVEGRLVSIRHRVGWRLVENLFEFISLFRRLAPDLLVTNGAGHAVMAALAARLFRVPIVYIEIGASTREPSRTGKIMALLRLADRYLYPWESLSRFFPGGTCTGPLL